MKHPPPERNARQVLISPKTQQGKRKTMSTLEELKDKFSNLTEEEKLAFLKSVMLSFCETFSKNSEKMMSEMIPLCMDMQGMMKMRCK